MATIAASAEESIITLRDSCGVIDKSLTESAPGGQERYRCQIRHATRRRRKWPFRSIGSSSILLIITWQLMIECSLNITVNRMQYIIEEQKKAAQWLTSETFIGITTLSISYPIASLLAEVVMSRYKLLSYCLKVMWMFYIAGSVISVCEQSLPIAKPMLLIIQIILVVLPQNILYGVFIITAVPLAMDQITGGSNANISAFIQWGCWAYFSGIAVSNISIL